MTGGCVDVAVVSVAAGTIVCVAAGLTAALVVEDTVVVAAPDGCAFTAAAVFGVALPRPFNMTIAPMPIARTTTAAIAIGTIDFFLGGASHGGIGTAAAAAGASVAAATAARERGGAGAAAGTTAGTG